ncbi:MAG: thioredoxin family protein [Fimbriimonadaceae bacterium]|nr:thioredoxin family protein [Chitinophagales bacterium]
MLNTFVLSLIFSFAQQQYVNTSPANEINEIRWVSIEEAMTKTAQNPKPIMIDFYTDWCGWCKKLDQTTYSDKEVIDYINKHYYAVKFDAEQKEQITFLGKTYSFVASGNRGTHQLAAQLANRNGRIGYPTITFLDANGNRLAAEGGYKDVPKMKSVLRYYGEEFYVSMTFNEFLTKQALEISAD